MGAPDDPAEYVRFDAGEFTVYVARQLLAALKPGAQKLPFYIDGYGRFWLVFPEE